MYHPSRPVPLSRVLELQSPELGKYVVEFPTSACFGVVTVGGLVVAYAYKATCDFVSKASRTRPHRHVLHYAVQFFRPTVASPQKAEFCLRVANSSKIFTTVHVEASQNGKVIFAGYFTLTDLSAPGSLTKSTGWQLSPPSIPPTSMQALEADNDPEWIGYQTPLSGTSYRTAHSYIKYFVPRKSVSRHVLDFWVKPTWPEPSAHEGAVWTNETLQFAIDNTLPVVNNFIDPVERPSWFDVVVKAGLEQRRARAEGKSDEFIGKNLGDFDFGINHIVSTMTISTEIKRLLPEEGTKWLLMRIEIKSLLDDRMDMDIVVLDQHNKLIATSQHALMVVPVDNKRAKKPSL